jgi:hypothetical protein
MSKKISQFQLAEAATSVQHDVLDPWLNEYETLRAEGEDVRAELEVLKRLTKVLSRIIEKEQGQ